MTTEMPPNPQTTKRVGRAALAEAVKQIPFVGPSLVSAAEELAKSKDEASAAEMLNAILAHFGSLDQEKLKALSKVTQDKAILLILVELAVRGTVQMSEIKLTLDKLSEGVKLHLATQPLDTGKVASDDLDVKIWWNTNRIRKGGQTSLVFDVSNISDVEAVILAYHDPSYRDEECYGVFDPHARSWVRDHTWLTDSHFISLLRPGDTRTFHWGKVKPTEYYGFEELGIWRTQLEILYEIPGGERKRSRPVSAFLEIYE